MINLIRYPLVLVLTFGYITGCIFMPGGTVVDSATVVYTKGAKKHTAAVQIRLPAEKVYSAIVRLLDENPELTIDHRNDQAFMVEVSKGTRSLTGQVTNLGPDHSLLYVWADAGASGLSGEELATSIVEKVCDELNVGYELVKY